MVDDRSPALRSRNVVRYERQQGKLTRLEFVEQGTLYIDEPADQLVIGDGDELRSRDDNDPHSQ